MTSPQSVSKINERGDQCRTRKNLVSIATSSASIVSTQPKRYLDATTNKEPVVFRNTIPVPAVPSSLEEPFTFSITDPTGGSDHFWQTSRAPSAYAAQIKCSQYRQQTCQPICFSYLVVSPFQVFLGEAKKVHENHCSGLLCTLSFGPHQCKNAVYKVSRHE